MKIQLKKKQVVKQKSGTTITYYPGLNNDVPDELANEWIKDEEIAERVGPGTKPRSSTKPPKLETKPDPNTSSR